MTDHVMLKALFIYTFSAVAINIVSAILKGIADGIRERKIQKAVAEVSALLDAADKRVAQKSMGTVRSVPGGVQ